MSKRLNADVIKRAGGATSEAIDDRFGIMQVIARDDPYWALSLALESLHNFLKVRRADSHVRLALTEDSIIPAQAVEAPVLAVIAAQLLGMEVEERSGDALYSHAIKTGNGLIVALVRRADCFVKLALTEDSIIPQDAVAAAIPGALPYVLGAKRMNLPSGRLFFSGDSLTANGQYPTAMATALGLPFVNSAVGGTGIVINGGTIGVRQGSIPMLVNLAGDLPAAAGSPVALASWSAEITNNQGSQNRTGVLEHGGGIPVMLRRTGAGAVADSYAVERTTAGSGAVTVPNGTRFMPDQAIGNELDFHYIQAGQNDGSYWTNHAGRMLIRDNILRMTDRIGHDRFGVLGLKYNSIAEAGGNKPIMNRLLEDTFGDRFVKTFAYLGSAAALTDALALDPALVITSTDEEFAAAGAIAPVLRSDSTHGTSTYYTLEGQWAARWHRGRGWMTGN